MKKIAIVLAIVLVVASMSLLLIGCSKVAGKTYVLDSVTVTSDDGTEETIASVKASVENTYKGAELTFNKDGTFVVTKDGTEVLKQYYKQDGKNIYISTSEEVSTEGDPALVVDGKKAVWTFDQKVITKTYTIKIVIARK